MSGICDTLVATGRNYQCKCKTHQREREIEYAHVDRREIRLTVYIHQFENQREM